MESDEVEVESSAQFLVGRFLKSITETIRDDRAEGIISGACNWQGMTPGSPFQISIREKTIITNRTTLQFFKVNRTIG